jgi:predicted Zn-dependent protease
MHDSTHWWRRRGLTLTIVAIACGACSSPRVPVVPPWSQLAGASVAIEDDERALWDDAKERQAELQKGSLLVNNAELTAYLNAVLARLLVDPLPPEAPRPKVWVVRSADRNAFTMPDGTMLVSTSMLAALEDESEVAALLGHELGHFNARHSLAQKRFERVSQSTVERMKVSREGEVYADQFSVEVLQRAGYDPRAMLRVLELADAEEARQDAGYSGPYQFRSHPFVRERLRDLKPSVQNQSRATQIDRATKSDYEQIIVAVLPVAAEVELRARLTERAASTIARLLALQPDSGHAHYLKAEQIRMTAAEGRRSSDARQAYERAVELAPDDPEAVRALGLLYHDAGEHARSEPLLRRYLTLAPDAADRKLVERCLGPPRQGVQAQ